MDRYRRVSAVVAAVAACLAVMPAAAAATGGARDLALGYRVYFGGFEALSLGVDVALAAERYKMDMNFRTRGLIGRLFPWTMQAFARGRLAGSVVLPETAGQRNRWRDRERWVTLRFADGRPTVTDAKPPVGDAGRGSLAGEALRGTIDLASAVLALSRAGRAARACAGRLVVFDGRRRYDIVLSRVGEEELRRTRYSVFQARALNCRAKMARRAGFKRGRGYGGWGSDGRAASLWLAPVFAHTPALPVRIEVETRWGWVIAHLASARMTADGVTRDLAAGEYSTTVARTGPVRTPDKRDR